MYFRSQAYATRLDLQYLFFIALLLRFGYFMLTLGHHTPATIPDLMPDSGHYWALGKDLAHLTINDHLAALVFGPGYSAYLAGFIALFGASVLPPLLIQIILGSVSCLLVYKIARYATDSYPISMIAGYVAALSFTGIALSTSLISDSLFFFLFLLATLFFLRGLRNFRRRDYILAGIFLAGAILTRGVGQFWPFALIVFSLFAHGINRGIFFGISFKRGVVLSLITPAIAIAIVSVWVIRNGIVYDYPAVSGAGAHGAGKVVIAVASKVEDKPGDEILTRWIDDYKAKHNRDEVSRGEIFKIYTSQTIHYAITHPGAFMGVYIHNTGANTLALNDLYRTHIPRYFNPISRYMTAYRSVYLHALHLAMVTLALIITLFRRKWFVAGFIVLVYGYFMLFMGLGSAQGSRLFYPAQLGWAIAFGIVITYVVEKIGKFPGMSSYNR